jgi:hypothetical protein
MNVLTLTLLEAGILLVNHIQLTLPPHDLTIGAAFLNGCTYFHDESICLLSESWNSPHGSFHVSIIYYLYRNMILPLVKS